MAGKKLILGIDVDECLAELLSSYILFHNARHGTTLAKEDFKEYRLESILGGTQEDVDEWLREFGYPDTIPVVEGSVEAIAELKGKYDELIAITARYSEFARSTESFLHRNFPGAFSETLYTGDLFMKHGITKADLCIERGIGQMVDDNGIFAHELAEKGINVVLLDKPWNRDYQGHKNVVRAYGWPAVVSYLGGSLGGSKV